MIVSNATPAAPVATQRPTPRLTPTQMQVFLKHLLGWPAWRIAMDLGLAGEQSVYAIMRSPEVQEALSQARETVVATGAAIMERLQSLAPLALDTVEDVMLRGDRDRDRLSAAQDLLDRAGYKPAERVDINKRVVSASFNIDALPADEREQLKQAALRAAKANLTGARLTQREEEDRDPIDITLSPESANDSSQI